MFVVAEKIIISSDKNDCLMNVALDNFYSVD